MKARMKSGEVVLYPTLPQTFKNDDIVILGGLELLTTEELEALGFYDVEEPVLTDTQMYLGVVWSEGGRPIYRIIDKPIIPKSTIYTKYQFLTRFTLAERLAIFAAAKQLPEAELWLEMFKICEEVDLTHAETITGVQMLEASGLITAGRAEEIMCIK